MLFNHLIHRACLFHTLELVLSKVFTQRQTLQSITPLGPLQNYDFNRFTTTALDNSKIGPIYSIYSGILAPLAHSYTSFCTTNNTDGEEGHSTQFRPVIKAFADEIRDA